MSNVIDSVLEDMFKKCKEKARKEVKLDLNKLKSLQSANLKLQTKLRKNERFVGDAEVVLKSALKIKEELKKISDKMTLNQLFNASYRVDDLLHDLSESVSSLKRGLPKN